VFVCEVYVCVGVRCVRCMCVCVCVCARVYVCACVRSSVCVCSEEGGGGSFRTDRKFRFLNSASCMLLRCSKFASHFALFTFPFLPSACLMHLLDVGKGVLYR